MTISSFNSPTILNRLTAQQMANNMAQAVVVVDNLTRIQFVNRAFTEITGYPSKEVIGRNPRLLQSGLSPRHLYRRMWKSLLETGQWQGDICNRRKNGALYTEWLAINAIKNSHGRVTHYMGIFSDISKKKKIEDSVRYRAFHDPLTDLANRDFFMEYLDHVIARARRNQTLAALLFIDLDGMKAVNDTLGHEAGDIALREAASRLTSSVRSVDSVARLGGDEFTVILDDINNQLDAEQVAGKIVRTLSAPYHIPDRKLSITASVGISLYPDHGTTINDLMSCADTAMYRAKNAGGNRYQCFASQIDIHKPPRLDLTPFSYESLPGSTPGSPTLQFQKNQPKP